MNYINDVREFQETFKMPVLSEPMIPESSRCKLRVNLLNEELKELKDSIKNEDLVEVIDALCDIQYVLSGAILEFGIGEYFGDFFNEVHRSNMSKACTSKQEAEETMSYYYNKDGTESYFLESDGKFIVYRKSDNKLLKSINYSSANIIGILENIKSKD